MNQLSQQEQIGKQKALDLLGDNPTEVDVKYVCYALQLSSNTVHEWLKEARQQGDIQIVLAEDEKDCEITGGSKKKNKLQIQVKNESSAQKAQVQKSSIKPSLAKNQKRKSVSPSKSQQDKNNKDSIFELEEKQMLFQKKMREKETSYQQFYENMQQLFPQFSNADIESLTNGLNDNPTSAANLESLEHKDQEQQSQKSVNKQPLKRGNSDFIVVDDDDFVQPKKPSMLQQPQKQQQEQSQQQEQQKQLLQKEMQQIVQQLPQPKKPIQSQSQIQIQQPPPQQQKTNGQNKQTQNQPKFQSEQKSKPQKESKLKPQTPKNKNQQPIASQEQNTQQNKPPPSASPKIVVQQRPNIEQPEIFQQPQQPQPNNPFIACQAPEYEAIQKQLVQASAPQQLRQMEMKPQYEIAQISLFTQQILQQQQQAQQMLTTLSNAYFLLVQQIDSLTNQVLSKK